MNPLLALCLFAAVAFSPALAAQVCSGGVDGGMDATGNLCNSPNGLAAETGNPSGAAAPTSARRTSGRVSSDSGLSPAIRANGPASGAAGRLNFAQQPRVAANGDHGPRSVK